MTYTGFKRDGLVWVPAGDFPEPDDIELEAYGYESRRKPPRTSRGPIPHGTVAGYKAHNRRREDPCEPCRTAERLAHQDACPDCGGPKKKRSQRCQSCAVVARNLRSRPGRAIRADEARSAA